MRQKWKNYKCQCDCKRLIRHPACEEDYVWDTRTYACECGKDCVIVEYLKDCESTKSLVDDLVVTCGEIVDTPESVSISPSD